MAKRKKKKGYGISDVQKGWAAIAIGAVAVFAFVAVNYQPVKADGGMFGGMDGVSGNLKTGEWHIDSNTASQIVSDALKALVNWNGESDVLGAVSGPSISSETWTVNGVETKFVRRAFVTATSTPCALPAPTNASSTLVNAQAKITVATSTATTWHIAKATTAFATTTLLTNPVSVGSGVEGVITHVASSTYVNLDSVDVFAPGDWLVFGAKGFFPAGTSLLKGVCQAEFRTI